MVEPALVGVGVLAVSVLVAVRLGLLFSRGVERLFRRGRAAGPDDEPEAEAGRPDTPEAEADEAATETQDA